MKINCALAIFALIFAAQVHADGAINKKLVFINCTGLPINVANDRAPYKYSFDPNSPAQNGYSPPYSFTIPAQALYSYNYFTIFYNLYEDNGMHVVFSGGINADLTFAEHYHRISTTSSQIDILNPGLRGSPITIALGCRQYM